MNTALDATPDAAPALLERLLAERHSCRAFLPQPVAPDTIEHMLALAQRSASWCNTQPWQLVLASGAATDRLRTVLQQAARSGPPASDIPFPPGYEGEHLARRRACGLQLYAALGIAREDRAASQAEALRNHDFFGAPHVALVLAPRSLGPYALVDCGVWVGNFLLAAAAHGIAAIPQAAPARHSDALRAHLDLPDGLAVVCAMAFGHADRDHPVNGYRTARADLAQVVRRIGNSEDGEGSA